MLRDKLNKLLSPYVEFKFNTEIQDPPLTVKDYKDDLAFILTKISLYLIYIEVLSKKE